MEIDDAVVSSVGGDSALGELPHDCIVDDPTLEELCETVEGGTSTMIDDAVDERIAANFRAIKELPHRES